MISNKIKESHKTVCLKKNKKTNNIKENRKSISNKKTKDIIELIEIIEQIKKQQNKDPIKIINKKELLKEKKDLEELPKVDNKKTFKRWEKDYISLIQSIIYQQTYYSGFKFDYNDYMLNNEKKIFSKMSVGFNTPPREVKYYDSPVLDNHKIDEIMDKFRFAQMKGQVLGDYFIPENVNSDDFEKFSYFKKLNPFLMILKYALNPL